MTTAPSPTRRSYDQYCPAARALDVVGQRWTLLLIRELLLGPQRFTHLRTGLSGIGPNLLAERLTQLQKDGLVRRVTLPAPATATVYELTDLGEELRPVLQGLTRFGMHFLGAPTPSDRFRLSWLMRVLEVMFRPERATGVHDTYEFRLDGETFHVRVDESEVQIGEGSVRDPDWVVETDVMTFIGLGAKIIDGAEAYEAGRIKVRGDPEAGARSVELLGPHLESLGEPGGILGAIQARVRPEAAGEASETYEFRTEGQTFHVAVDRDEVEVRAGPATRPAMVFTADLQTLIAMYMDQLSAQEAVSQAGATLEGDPAAAGRAWAILGVRP